MAIKIMTSFFRARGERKREQETRQAEAIEIFLARLERSFPQSLPSSKMTPEAAELSRKILERRREGKALLSEALKVAGVDALALAALGAEYAANMSTFVRHSVGGLTRKGEITLSQVRPVDTFSRVLVAVRLLYADDLKDYILVRDVVKVIVEKVLSSPVKRA